MRRHLKRGLIGLAVLAAAVGGSAVAYLKAAPTRPRAEVTLRFFPDQATADGWTAEEFDRFRQAVAARFTDPAWQRKMAYHHTDSNRIPPNGDFDDKAAWVIARTRLRWADANRLEVGLTDADPGFARGYLDYLAMHAARGKQELMPDRHNPVPQYMARRDAGLEQLWHDIQKAEAKAAGGKDGRAAFELPLMKEHYKQLFTKKLEEDVRRHRAYDAVLIRTEPSRTVTD